MLKEMLTSDQLSLVISQAAAPAFLLGAVASFLSVLVSHLGRIVDRARATPKERISRGICPNCTFAQA